MLHVHVEDPDGAGEQQPDRADDQAGRGQHDRRQPVALLGRHEEERRAAEHGQQRPDDPDRVEVGSRQQVEHQDEPEPGGDAAGRGQRARGAGACRTQSQNTTAAGAVNSIRRATPTCIRSTALK